MPKIDFNVELKNLNRDGPLMREDNIGEGKDARKVLIPATLKYVAVTALCTPIMKEEQRQDGLTPSDATSKLRRFHLASKIQLEEGTATLTVEEVVELKNCIGNSTFTVVAAGQALALLDAA